MKRRLRQTLACVVGCLVALGTPAASAQAAGQLTGVVRETTGVVLPDMKFGFEEISLEVTPDEWT